MKWHLYKQDEPDTWPHIDCPLLVCFKSYHTSEMEFGICDKYIKGFGFMLKNGGALCTECYYAYIAYAPSGYETYHPIKCTCERCPQGYDDNGYCMDYDHEYTCGCKKEITEYSIKEKIIWKEFE